MSHAKRENIWQFLLRIDFGNPLHHILLLQPYFINLFSFNNQDSSIEIFTVDFTFSVELVECTNTLSDLKIYPDGLTKEGIVFSIRLTQARRFFMLITNLVIVISSISYMGGHIRLQS